MMGFEKPSHAAYYRAQTQADRHYNHKRKQCACGKQITAKQLSQFGKCVTCLRK